MGVVMFLNGAKSCSSYFSPNSTINNIRSASSNETFTYPIIASCNSYLGYVEFDESGDMFKLTQERLEEIMGDDDSIASLLTDSPEFHELGFLLTNAYGDAYSTAERDAYYNRTIDELKDFFETQDLGYWGTKEGFTYDKEGKRIPRMKDIYFVNITKVIKQMIMDTVDNNMSDFDEYNAFENLGSFEWILKEYYADEIRLNLERVSPDYGDIDTLFNEYFRDNI